MNEIAGSELWRGGSYDVFSNPEGTFLTLNRNGAFATSLREPLAKIGHIVVVDGLDESGRVMIRDPYGKGTRYLMQWDEFTRVWEGQITVYKR